MVEAKKAGDPVEVASLTTATEQVMAMPDGTFSKTVNTSPVRMEQEGQWKDISTDLVIQSENGQAILAPEMTPTDVKFGAGGNSHVATIKDDKGNQIVESWPFGDLPTPLIEKNTATYRSVLPGVDFIQTAHVDGLSQVLKIYTPEAARDPRVKAMRLYLDSNNLKIKEDGSGGLKAEAADSGESVLRAAQGQWWDSTYPDASAAEPGGPGITRPFSIDLSGPEGAKSQGFGMEDIFRTENLVYPVYVDPDWSAGRVAFLYVDSGYASTSYWNGRYTDGAMKVGYLQPAWAADGRPHVTRSFWQFDTRPINDKAIFAAQFKVVAKWAPSCQARPVSAWVTGVIEDGNSWNSQPGQLRKLDTQSFAKGKEGCEGQGSVAFNMAAAKDWLAGSPRWVVGLYADNESDPLAWKQFYNEASITIRYGTPPAKPILNSISSCAFACLGQGVNEPPLTRDAQPTFSLSSSDPDGSVDGDIGINMTIRDGQGRAVAHTPWTSQKLPGGGGSTTWRVPTRLSDGVYSFEAQTTDSTYLASTPISTRFEVATTAPAPPKITSGSAYLNNNQIDPDAVVGATELSFSLSNDSQRPVKGFVYAVTAADATPPTFPADNAALGCGRRTGPYVTVCLTEQSGTSIKVAAVDEASVLTAWSFDRAGNVDLPQQGAAKSVPFRVGQTAPMPETVLPLELKNGAKWVGIQANRGIPASNSCQGSAPDGTEPRNTVKVLELSGSGQYAQTSERAVDTSQSFSTSGWFCPSSPAAPSPQTVMAQMNDSGNAAGMIRLASGGRWEFAMPTAGTPPVLESVRTAEGAVADGWFFVNSIYDRVNQQLRLTVADSRVRNTWIIATTSAVHPGAQPDKPALLGASNPMNPALDGFIGQIFQPVFAQGVLIDAQLTSAWNTKRGEQGVLK
ncbi:MAG: hypothetical protein IIZ13_06650 [Renibacterium sp.]|nr:hypothetical protein [Renibacterium sp.]